MASKIWSLNFALVHIGAQENIPLCSLWYLISKKRRAGLTNSWHLQPRSSLAQRLLGNAAFLLHWTFVRVWWGSVDSCTLIQNEHTQRRAHFAFHFTVLTTSRSSSSGNYIDYFRISGINEPGCSSSPLWSPLLPCDITLLSDTQTPFPPHTLFFSQHATWQWFPD